MLLEEKDLFPLLHTALSIPSEIKVSKVGDKNNWYNHCVTHWQKRAHVTSIPQIHKKDQINKLSNTLI